MLASRHNKTRKSLQRRVRAALGPTTDRERMMEILTEMHHIVLDAGARLGVPANDRRRALASAAKDTRRRRPSVLTIEPSAGLAEALGHWRTDKRYRTPDGSPRVLSIKGRGATFETLARAYAPAVGLNRALKLVCDNAEVMRLRGGKIALLGSPVLIVPKTPETTAASLALQFRRVADTVVFNAAIPAQVKGTGRFERQVKGVLTAKAFQQFSQSVRQQLQALCDQVDASLVQPGVRTKRVNDRGKPCGIGIYVFRDDGGSGESG